MIGAFLWRDWASREEHRLALVFDLAFGILNLAIYFYISRAVQARGPVDLQGAESYFAFAAVGIVFLIVVQAAAAGLARTVREQKLTGGLEATVVQPVSAAELSLGLAGFPFLFAAGRALVYLAVAAAFLGLDLSHTDFLGLALVALAAGPALMGVGVALAALVLFLRRGGDAITRSAGFGLGFLSGAFFPVAVLPGWLEALSHALPLRPALDGLRAAIYRGEGWGDSALVLAAWALALLPVAVLAFRFALAGSIRKGSLSEQ